MIKPYSIMTSQIVECNALPTLILMLRSEDTAIHYEAVGSFEDAIYIINYSCKEFGVCTSHFLQH